MGKWRNVVILGCDEGVPDSLRVARAELVSKIEKLNKYRALLDEQLAALSGRNLDGKFALEIEAIRDAKISLWQNELSVRNEYAAWLNQYAAALRDLTDQAHQNRSDAEVKLLDSLASLGYDITPGSQAIGRVTTDMLCRNPLVHQALNRVQDVEALQNHVHDAMTLNESLTHETEDQISHYKATMLAAVAG